MNGPAPRLVGDVFNPYSLFNGAFIPEALCRLASVPPGAKICYGRLVRYGGEDGKCHPSVPTIAAEIGVSDRQCRTYLRQLEEQRFVRRASRGKGHSNRYEFLWHSVFQDEQPRKDTSVLGRKDTSANPGRILPPEESQEEERTVEQKLDCSLPVSDRKEKCPDWFEDFWRAYPSTKGSKKSAFAKAKKALRSESDIAEAQLLLNRKAKHIRSMRARGEWVANLPHVERYFSKGLWSQPSDEDELETESDGLAGGFWMSDREKDRLRAAGEGGHAA